MNVDHACPYVVAGSICIVGGQRSWTCVRHKRIVCRTYCEACRLVLTRTPGVNVNVS